MNFFTILVLAAVAYFVYGQFKRKKDTAFKISKHQQTEQQAKIAGINITAQPTGRVTNSGEVHGSTDYKGNTGGIEWTLRSTVVVGDGGRGNNHVWKRKSVWRSNAVTLPAGKFIMVMSTPSDLKPRQIERGGFMNTIINKAAEAVLDLYVTGYFGSEYKSLVSIGEDGVKLDRDTLKDFFILTNYEPVAQTFFDDATASVLGTWKKSNLDFTHERQVDQFGLLFSPDGVVLTCQASMNTPDEAKLFSDFSAALTAKMKGLVT